MKVTADAAVCDHVVARGGTLWVRSTRHQCCHGPITLLSASTDRPEDASSYEPIDDTGLPIAIRFKAAHGSPDQLVLELRGLVRKRPVAFWDGCAYKP